MRPFRSREYSGLYLAVVFLTICDLPAATQSNLAFESTDCKLYGDICLGPTAESAAKEVCSKIYKKNCTNATANNNKCTREYVKDAQGGDASRCVWDLIMELSKISSADRCGLRATEALVLRQEISEMVTTASLQVDGFLSEIDSETGQVRAVHDDLSDRRDAAVSLSTLGSAVGTGGGAVGSSLALARKTATVGNWVGAVAGGVGTLFAFLGWYQQPRGPKGCFPDVNPGRGPNRCAAPRVNPCVSNDPDPPTGCTPTMLYHLVFPGADVEADVGFHSRYEPSIDNYLEAHRRRETLVNPWVQEATRKKGKGEQKTDDPDEVKNSANYIVMAKERYLFSNGKSPRKLSIDELTDRANKLSDLRAVVARMSRDLGRLSEDLSTSLQCRDAGGTNTQ